VIKIIKVTDESLSPFFLPGDYVLIGKCAICLVLILFGDILLLLLSFYGLFIKEVTSVNKDSQEINLKGIHPHSINIQQIGPVAISEVQGKVLFQIKNPFHLD